MSATYPRNPLMSDFTENYFETNDGVKLRFLHKGTGTPLILCHGWSDYADSWFLNAPAFAEEYSVYALDLRGHGFSVAKAGARISRLAADLHEFIESLGVSKVNLAGWSMGCSVIWSYIDLFGEGRIHKLVFDDEPPMLAANPLFTREELLETGSNRMDVWLLVNEAQKDCDWEGEDSAFNAVFPACFDRGVLFFSEDDMKRMPDNFMEKWSAWPEMPEFQNRFLAQLLADHLRLDWRDRIRTIKSPALYLTGDLSHATTHECAEWMVKNMADCKWVRFTAEDYGNHNFIWYAYKKFNRVVLDFLRDV